MNSNDNKRRPARAGKAVSDWLGRLTADNAVARHARRLMALQPLVDRCVPASLRVPLTVANFREGTLVLTAPNGALAHRARLAVPALLAALQQQEPAVRVLRIEVQRTFPEPRPPRKVAVLSTAARESLENLAHTLPDSDVKAAVERLLRRHGGEGMKEP